MYILYGLFIIQKHCKFWIRDSSVSLVTRLRAWRPRFFSP